MQKRQIISTVRIDNRTYGPGMEAELVGLLLPENIEYLKAQRAILGDWGTSKTEPASVEEETLGLQHDERNAIAVAEDRQAEREARMQSEAVQAVKASKAVKASGKKKK
jgi:hypothetical protein